MYNLLYLKDIAALPCEIYVSKSHKFNNTVLKKRCFDRNFFADLFT